VVTQVTGQNIGPEHTEMTGESDMIEYDAAMKVMVERFGHDSLISLATLDDGRPTVRTVGGYFEDGAFYVVTDALSNKLRQIQANPVVGLSGEWFSGHGVAENLGHVLDEANADIMTRVRAAFADWLCVGGDVDENDPHTYLLRIQLTDGVLSIDGARHDVDFVAKTA
jgi:hypothetical protein